MLHVRGRLIQITISSRMAILADDDRHGPRPLLAISGKNICSANKMQLLQRMRHFDKRNNKFKLLTLVNVVPGRLTHSRTKGTKLKLLAILNQR
jgi:hypothetical protein